MRAILQFLDCVLAKLITEIYNNVFNLSLMFEGNYESHCITEGGEAHLEINSKGSWGQVEDNLHQKMAFVSRWPP